MGRGSGEAGEAANPPKPPNPPERWGPRMIDLDIIFFGDMISR